MGVALLRRVVTIGLPKLSFEPKSIEMAKLNKVRKLKSRHNIEVSREPLDGYREIMNKELQALRKLSLKEAIRQSEVLLREAAKWKR